MGIDKIIKEVWGFNTKLHKWQRKADLIKARTNVAICSTYYEDYV